MAARMTETTPIKKFDGLPPALVRPHHSGDERLLDIFHCGVLKMARGQLAFKQTDVTRALRAVFAAGQSVQRVEIDREGKIVAARPDSHARRLAPRCRVVGLKILGQAIREIRVARSWSCSRISTSVIRLIASPPSRERAATA